MAKPLSAEVVEALLAAQDIPLAPGRAERLAPGVSALAVADPLRAGLAFEVDATTFLLALSRNK
jgi:hypothetical protein